MNSAPRKWISRFSACLGLGFWAAVCAAQPRAGNVVLVHLDQTINRRILGCGVQFDPFEQYPPSKNNWQIILQRATFLHPGFIRTMVQPGLYATNTKGGKGHYVWQQPVNKARYRRYQRLVRILHWAQTHHVAVMLGDWWPKGFNATSGREVARWARRTAHVVRYLRFRRNFFCIKYFNFVNEPNHVKPAVFVRAVRALHRSFAVAGLMPTVAITAPDTYGDPNSKTQWHFPLLPATVTRAARAVGCYDIHWYAHDWEIQSGWVEQTMLRQRQFIDQHDKNAPHKALLASEAGLIQGKHNGDQQPRVKTFRYGLLMADYAAQVFRAGWDGISEWDLDDAMHVVNHQTVTRPPGRLTLKIWGFWNSQGKAMGNPADFRLRPAYYSWALMSRLFPAGTRIVASTDPSGAKGFRTLAGIRMAGRRRLVSIALINDSGKPKAVTVRIPAETRAANFTEYRYFRHDRPTNKKGFPKAARTLRGVDAARGVTLTVPPRGVIWLAGQ